MKVLSFEEAIQAQFDSLTKKVIKHTAYNYHDELSRRSKKEVSFSQLSEIELNSFGMLDQYMSDYTSFDVLGLEVQILDDQLSNAIQVLSERKREIVLLSYFLDMSDSEIAEVMKLVRSTVHKHRTKALLEIKKILEEDNAKV